MYPSRLSYGGYSRPCEGSRLPTIRILVFSTALLANFMVAGCAELPLCEKFGFRYGVDNQTDEPVFALDSANVVKLANLMKGLSEGTCRLNGGNGT